jgi:hypothetical protein
MTEAYSILIGEYERTMPLEKRRRRMVGQEPAGARVLRSIKSGNILHPVNAGYLLNKTCPMEIVGIFSAECNGSIVHYVTRNL